MFLAYTRSQFRGGLLGYISAFDAQTPYSCTHHRLKCTASYIDSRLTPPYPALLNSFHSPKIINPTSKSEHDSICLLFLPFRPHSRNRLTFFMCKLLCPFFATDQYSIFIGSLSLRSGQILTVQPISCWLTCLVL
jgi:hypothetical protein